MLSVVIASYNNPMGQYLTLFSALQQLQKLNLEYEIIIAADGGEPTKWEKLPHVKCLRITSGSPQGTRDAGIQVAKGNSVLVLEDHVVVSDIGRLLEEHNSLGSAMTFCSRKGEGSELFHAYGVLTDWDGNLWIKRTLYQPQNGAGAYRVAQFGHSCYVIDRKIYNEVGGYTNFLTGWGGEEHLLSLKIWLAGYEVWMASPDLWHAHYLTPGAHADALGSERLKKNFAISKYILSGNGEGVYVTPAMKAERDQVCLGPFGGDIKKLRDYFNKMGVVN